MAYLTNDMIQYNADELIFVKVSEDTKLYPCGTTGVAIIIDDHPDYRYSLLFGSVITHRFKTIEAMREWNSDYNHFMLAVPISMAIIQIEKEEGGI